MVSAYNLSLINATVPQGFSVTFSELVSDWCGQLDEKILLMLMFVLTFYVIRVFVLPRGLVQLYTIPMFAFVMPLVEKFLRRLESFLDTASLFSSIFLLYIFWKQKAFFGRGYFAWLIVLASVILLVMVANSIDWIKTKQKQKVM